MKYIAVILLVCNITTDTHTQFAITDIGSSKEYQVQYHTKPEYSTVEVYLQDGGKQVDTLIVPYVGEVRHSEVLSTHFLSLVVKQRCGTECDKQCTRIIAVRNGTLYLVAAFMSYMKGDLTTAWTEHPEEYSVPDEHILYEVKMDLTGETTSNYTLMIGESYYYTSKLKPSSNEQWEKRHRLHFDEQKMMFSNTVITLDGIYNIDDPFQTSLLAARKSFQKKTFPAVVLERQEHVFLPEGWYELYATPDGERELQRE